MDSGGKISTKMEEEMLQWANSEEPTKGPRESHAPSGEGSEYRIRGPLWSSDPATRTVAEYYAVLRGSTVFPRAVGVASERVGEAPTLKEAKAMAQRHHEAVRR
jgi:hypothetical protein